MIWFAAVLLVAQTRIASDFEIAQMKQQIARSHDFLSQLSGHLNLGDLYATRTEMTTARTEYAQALKIANDEAIAARKASDITRYATAVMYAALSDAKLGNSDGAFTNAEEAIRYTSSSAKSWNLYSTAMTLLRTPRKAVAAARNAVAIAKNEVAQSASVANRLDLAVYEYTLATSLIDTGESDEAKRLLRTITAELRSDNFASLRREVARTESFEIYSSARGDAAAYLSLLNRAGLRLAALLEERHDVEAARHEYDNVLVNRSDEPTALAAMARLAPPSDRERYFAAAFDANPFSLPLVRQYQAHLRSGTASPVAASNTTGSQVRQAFIAISRGEMRSARDLVDTMLQQYPNNETLRILRAETQANAGRPSFLDSAESIVTPTSDQLRQLIARLQGGNVTADERTQLDRLTLANDAVFDNASVKNGQTILSSGRIGDVRFRFSEPTAFSGTFGTRVRLTYKLLGVTEVEGADALLVEPVNVEAAP